MGWRVERIVRSTNMAMWLAGDSCGGFFDRQGRQYILDYHAHWVGCLESDGRRAWSCGPEPIEQSPCHIHADLKGPGYLSELADGSLLVSCFENHRIYRIDPDTKSATVLIDGDHHGLKDTGYALVGRDGHIWLNEVTGCRIWEFDPEGRPLRAIGDGEPGCQTEDVPINQVRFNWVYDIRLGPDDNLYILDSKNYMLRMIDLDRGVVTRIAGTGEPGYTGDDGDARLATFGSNPESHFDGPWAMSLDEQGNLFIGDTQNHVIRMIDHSTGRISTIAGRRDDQTDQPNDPADPDPMHLSLTLICGMMYHDGRLYIPAGKAATDDQIILHRT